MTICMPGGTRPMAGPPGGRVWLVGAGPGAADLLTLRAAAVLAAADVVLVDDLVDADVLALVGAGARIVRVGKRGGCRSTPQDFIQRLMLRHARQGRRVVRLKGGDPFVFGRGGEEKAWLQARGVAVDVVPGVTAGIAVATALGIPVTHRGFAAGVTFVTGHLRDGAGASGPDWRALAAGGTTLVVYMGVARIGSIVEGLLAGGLPATTPAAVVASGTLPAERRLLTRLGRLPAAIAAAGIASPAVVVIGRVVELADGWPTADAAPASSSAAAAPPPADVVPLPAAA